MSTERYFPPPTEILIQTALYVSLDLELETKGQALARQVRDQRAAAVKEVMRATIAAGGEAPVVPPAAVEVSRAHPPVRPVGGPSLLPAAPTPPSSYTRLEKFKAFRGPMHVYCVECQHERTFKGAEKCLTAGPEPGMFSMAFQCQWKESHALVFHFRIEGTRWLQKVGQSPSVKDLAESDLRRYQRHLDRDVLHKRMFEDLRLGVGLFAHGVGAGSFVYLRRVFERLVAEAEGMAREADPATEVPLRMEDKILAFRSFLPEVLVENRVTYGILSEGLHNLDLTEQECLERFPALRAGIELILDSQIERIERDRKEKETRAALAEIAATIKGKQK